jgi:hypothetical protein
MLPALVLLQARINPSLVTDGYYDKGAGPRGASFRLPGAATAPLARGPYAPYGDACPEVNALRRKPR